MSRRPPRLRARRPWARVIQGSAFVRKELVEIARQPRLLALLVVGPFALLLLFGAGYRDDDLRMRTMFVGPAGSFYEDAVADHRDELERFVRPEGFTDDLDAARARLADGDVDAIVVFPTDPLDTVLAGERAEIDVLHDKIDPIQQTAIEVAARLAVQEVNAQVVDGRRRLRAGRAATGRRGAGRVDRGRRRTSRRRPRPAMRPRPPRRPPTVSTGPAELRDLVAIVGPRARTPRRRRRRHPPRRAGPARRDPRRGRRPSPTGRAPTSTARADALAEQLDEVATTIPDVAALDPRVLVRPFAARHREHRARARRAGRLLHAVGAGPAAAAPRRDVRRAVARARPRARVVRAAPGRSAVVVGDRRPARRSPTCSSGCSSASGCWRRRSSCSASRSSATPSGCSLAFALVLLASLALGHDHLAAVAAPRRRPCSGRC